MSPSVERERFNDIFIAVRLLDKEPFKAEEFDRLVKGLAGPQLFMYFLKYVVIGDVMYIFPHNIYHDDAESSLRAGGKTGELQSAGMVGVTFDEPDVTRRKIGDYSVRLREVLPRSNSDTYKFKVIQKALGDFFEVT